MIALNRDFLSKGGRWGSLFLSRLHARAPIDCSCLCCCCRPLLLLLVLLLFLLLPSASIVFVVVAAALLLLFSAKILIDFNSWEFLAIFAAYLKHNTHNLTGQKNVASKQQKRHN